MFIFILKIIARFNFRHFPIIKTIVLPFSNTFSFKIFKVDLELQYCRRILYFIREYIPIGSNSLRNKRLLNLLSFITSTTTSTTCRKPCWEDKGNHQYIRNLVQTVEHLDLATRGHLARRGKVESVISIWDISIRKHINIQYNI